MTGSWFRAFTSILLVAMGGHGVSWSSKEALLGTESLSLNVTRKSHENMSGTHLRTEIATREAQMRAGRSRLH